MQHADNLYCPGPVREKQLSRQPTFSRLLTRRLPMFSMPVSDTNWRTRSSYTRDRRAPKKSMVCPGKASTIFCICESPMSSCCRQTGQGQLELDSSKAWQARTASLAHMLYTCFEIDTMPS